MDIKTLLDDNISVEQWCNDIINLQEKEVYTSLTAPHDLNHIVKASVSLIIDYLKNQGKDSMIDVKGKTKEALAILVPYLRKNEVWKPNRSKPLNDEELDKAVEDLHIPLYNAVDRKFSDPQLRGQNYALFSFQASKGCTPDPSGIYGFIKIRGAFNRLEEAEEKSKELIQFFSANKIFVVEVGAPTPLWDQISDRSKILEVDHPDRDEQYGDLIKEQTIKEKQQIEEIKKKTEELKADVAKDPNDIEPLQRYLELVQKRSTGAYLYTKHQEKLQECKNIVLSARKQLLEMDEEYPNLKNEYMDHYNKTCEERGINQATDDMAVMIKQYFGEDPDLGF